ncbi:sialidase family protein [Cognatilysobacter segetis]|uniref:sialidase family protein n=1 Tax=Cognatilysobacter segetis TaxID=2492394 RepID=UPI0010617B00|nr:sialidase family protein [Lysobacter segetis]
MTTDLATRATLAVAVVLAIAACSRQPAAPSASAPKAPATAATAQAPWTLPVRDGMQPDLAVAPDGALLLSWVEGTSGAEGGRTLRVARWKDGRWTPAATVARGDWFGNAVDTPQIEQTRDGALWATWMRASPTGGHARDVVVARSGDGGASWSVPVPVNTDGTATEHGFVSLWRASPDSIGVAWLDGRAKTGVDEMHEGHGGPMQMLRAAVFDARLQRHGETAIDSTVCDCCHTAVALADDGPVMVYRDRTADEVRDIHAAVLRDGAWRDVGAVHADGWVMPGCPVNGPAVAATGHRVVAAWYTAPGDAPRVSYAMSEDGGEHFGDAVPLAQGAGVLGRVAVAGDARGAWLGWIEEANGVQALKAVHRGWSSASASPATVVATLHTRGNGAGMPRLAATGDAAYAVWTDTVDGRPQLVGRRL